jgi:hypothetical protein
MHLDTIRPTKIQVAFPPRDLISFWFSRVTDLWLEGDCPVTDDVRAPRQIQRSKVDSGFLRRKDVLLQNRPSVFMVCWQTFLGLIWVDFYGRAFPLHHNFSICKHSLSCVMHNKAPQIQFQILVAWGQTRNGPAKLNTHTHTHTHIHGAECSFLRLRQGD